MPAANCAGMPVNSQGTGEPPMLLYPGNSLRGRQAARA